MKNNTLRYILALLLIVAFACGLIACGGDTESTPSTESIGESTPESLTDIETQSDTDTESMHSTESVSVTESENNTEPTDESVTESGSEAPTETVTESDAPTETVTESEAPTETVTESDTPTETVTESDTPTETVTESDTPTETVTESETPTETVTESESETETQRPDLTWETYDPALDNSTVDTSAKHEVDQSQWTATDGLDRVVSTNTQTGNKREDKIVAIFYWTWHGSIADTNKAFNNQENINKLIEMGYTERDYVKMTVAELQALGIQTEMGPYHHWDEPIYGYYDGDDEWVIRKQAELLAAADVDVVFFDNTNGSFTWLETAMKVMKVFSEARAQGVDAPCVSFMLPFAPIDGTRNQLVQLWENIYTKNYCSDIWFRLDEKPMVMGWNQALDLNNPTQKAIYDFFDFRMNMAGYLQTESEKNQWGWLSKFPQAFFHNDKGIIEEMTVGVSLNHNYLYDFISPMSAIQSVIGRAWTSRGIDTSADAILKGACFSEQWENALSVDPKTVFVTGWNEWIAMRLNEWAPGGGHDVFTNCFVDQYNAEFSRDCEPSKGIMKDYYYYQLADYIRQFKGTNPIEQATGEKLIDVYGGFGQWSNVGPTYNDYFGLTDRDFKGYIDPNTGRYLHYTNYTGRNDFYDAKVARDYKNVYFMVRTVDNITPYTDEYWMRLYIDTGVSDENWEHYEFILNKRNPDDSNTATLERFTGDGFNTKVVCKVSYSVQGNVMMVCIPKTALGITEDQYDFEFNFKWTDNTLEDGDIMQWYVNGDTAPVGRFNYCYSTTGSAPFVEALDSNGKTYIDMKDPARQQEITDYLLGDSVNMDYSFTSEGLVITSKADGKNSDFVLDFEKASPYVSLERYSSVVVTFKVVGDTSEAIRIAISVGDTAVKNTGGTSMTVTQSGDLYTATAKLRRIRATEGYLGDIGIYFSSTAPAGSSIIIESIYFVE